MNQTKIIRLKTGEDLITEYTFDVKSMQYHLINPMTLFFKRLSAGKSVIMLAPWMPMELLESTDLFINMADVLTEAQPKKSLIDYYLSAVEESEEMIEQFNDVIDEALRDTSNSVSFDELSQQEELSEEDGDMLEPMDKVGSKGKLIH